MDLLFPSQLFDNGKKGFITEEELTEILHNAFNMSEVDAKELFHDVDTNKNGKISFGKCRMICVGETCLLCYISNCL